MEILELAARFGWLITLVFQALIGWAAWSLRKQFVPREAFGEFTGEIKSEIHQEFEAAHARHRGIEERVSRLELQMEQVPSRELVHELQICVTRAEGTMGRLSERLDGVNQLVGRVETMVSRQEDYLLKHGDRS